MMSMSSKLPSVTAGIVSAAFVLGLAASPASAATVQEITLATPAQGLTYCQSGKMKTGDVAYISGGPGLVQEGPETSCTQAVVTKTKIKKAIEVNGAKVKECALATATQATSYCESGSMSTWNIDYIDGKVGRTISGPGYGCTLNYSTSSIGTAQCK
jgi:enamine deaminase RidA (YjgF/YER057c/UK114 family)